MLMPSGAVPETTNSTFVGVDGAGAVSDGAAAGADGEDESDGEPKMSTPSAAQSAPTLSALTASSEGSFRMAEVHAVKSRDSGCVVSLKVSRRAALSATPLPSQVSRAL